MLLSVVIPTKNRPHTLSAAVRAALAVQSPDLEIVVQDCSDDLETRNVVAALSADSRLRYEKSPGLPSMTENWNHAFERVHGDYVIVIGDDDAVGREIANAARWAKEHDVDAIADDRIVYFWPNYQLGEVAGTARVSRHTGRVESDDALRTLDHALSRYPVNLHRLPHIYQGLVRTRLMHEIKARTGQFFHSMAPDYYSAVALSCIVKRFVRVSYPVCAAGASAAANSGRMHEGTDYLHALEFGRQFQWSRYVPPFYSMTTTIVDATSKALIHMGREELVSTLDFSSFYGDCLAQQPRRARAIARELTRLLREHRSLAPAILPRIIPRTVQMATRRVRHIAGRPAALHGLKRFKARLTRVDYDVIAAPDIVEALERTQRLLESRGVQSPFGSSPAPELRQSDATPDSAVRPSAQIMGVGRAAGNG
jgi:hypothetical protein